MTQTIGSNDLFERRALFPDVEAQARLRRLVGLDDHMLRLTKILALLVNPAGLETWARKHHPDATQLLAAVLTRPPLVVLAGDVGCGKSALAENIGDAVARQEKIDVALLPLSLSSRGQGRVGEMTQLISAAFETTLEEARKVKSSSGRARGAVILLVDEADALAQSREATQMHHEDRAGVNAFIRGVDRMAGSALPVATIMCTNRPNALDPAVRRRAAEILVFTRPNEEQRRRLFTDSLAGCGLSPAAIDALVEATGPCADRPYGFAFSDIVQRLLPAVILDAYPTGPVVAARAVAIARSIAPTAPFREQVP